MAATTVFAAISFGSVRLGRPFYPASQSRRETIEWVLKLIFSPLVTASVSVMQLPFVGAIFTVHAKNKVFS